jgi:hypothetical protein
MWIFFLLLPIVVTAEVDTDFLKSLANAVVCRDVVAVPEVAVATTMILVSAVVNLVPFIKLSFHDIIGSLPLAPCPCLAC